MGPAIHNHFEKPSRLIVTGRSTVGKTTLAVDIILTRILPRVRRCYAVCPTFNDQPALQRLRDVPGAFPSHHIFTQVDDSVFDHIHQQLLHKPAPTLLYLDDAAAEAATNKGNKGAFSRLCNIAPHIHLYMVGVFQRITAASPAFRDNTEGLISFISSKALDSEIIIHEFNPHPTDREAEKWVRRVLDESWQSKRFCFIWREGFTGKMHFYKGLDEEILYRDT